MPAFRTLFLAAVIGAGALRAQTPATPAPGALSDDELRLRGVFDTALPQTERKHALKLIFHPHFGDFTQRDELRIPLGLRYGLSQNWEVTGEVEGYFSHGLGDRSFFDEAGLSLLHLGTKYHWDKSPWEGWDTAAGVDYTMTIGHPPSDVTDGLEHFVPFVTFSHRLEDWPEVRVFWGLSADETRRSDIPGERRKNQLGDDMQKLTGGLVWQRGDFGYTLEASVATTRLTGETHEDLFSIQPGIIWKLPRGLTPNSRDRWVLGVGLRSSYGPDGFDYGASAKLRVNLDFKRWWRQVTHSER